MSTPSNRKTLAKEGAIMDLWDAGATKSVIADKLGLSFAEVSRVIAYMGDTHGDLKIGERAVRSQTAALLARIREHHPERVTA